LQERRKRSHPGHAAGGVERSQKLMLKSLYRFDCLTPLEIGEYHLGLIPPPARARFEQHFQACPLCQDELAALRQYMEAETFRPVAASPSSLAEKLSGWVQEIVAVLAGPTPAVALRGSTPGQIIAEAEGLTILLTPQLAQDGGLTLSGQIAADDQARWSEAVVQLQREGELVASTMVDDGGAFRCEGLRPGLAQLRITPRSGLAVRIPNIEFAA
jgi:hypothetical protein